MITVKEAKDKIREMIAGLPPCEIEVSKSLNHILAEDVFSKVDLPPFDQSAMDGYAVNIQINDGYKEYSLPVVEEIRAGDSISLSLDPQTAAAIYTGAPIPLNTTCVVIQEHVNILGEKIVFKHEAIKPNGNIRLKGSQIKTGELAIPKGTVMNPAAIGLVSSLGMTKVNVFSKPMIHVITTGNELIQPGEPLGYGKIYESNSVMMKAAVRNAGFEVSEIHFSKDESGELNEMVQKVLKKSDVLIVSGGISVGKYDLVKSALEAAGVQQVFYKIAQKPGKPVYFGMLGTKPVFALPGNPGSLLVCFYEYVLPVLRILAGDADPELKKYHLPLLKEYYQKGTFDLFLKAYYDERGVEILEGQESNILTSFAKANSLVYLPGREKFLSRDTLVEVHILP